MADVKKDVKTKKKEDCLDIDEFILFYQMMTKRDEVDELFEKSVSQQKVITSYV